MLVTPAMDMWPWLVRHAGWLLERDHVKGNKKTAFEDCFGKLYLMKFAKAALFRVKGSKRNQTGSSTREICPWHLVWQDHGIR